MWTCEHVPWIFYSSGSNETSFADQDLFSQFAGIGVGHLGQNVQDQIPALSTDTSNELEYEDDIMMQEIDGCRTVDQDHEGSVDGDNDNDNEEKEEKETLRDVSEDKEGGEDD